MRWDRDHRSDDVIDQRGSGGGAPLGAGVGVLFWLASRFGLPGLLIGGAILAGAYFLTPRAEDSQSAVGPSANERGAATQDEKAAFVGFVLDDVQSTWQQIFSRAGKRYTPAKLVLFSDATRSGCGYGSAEVGPFYCPSDRRVYIDLGFYQELDRRFGAPGDFAQAYVIAHEIGHHVQTLLGLDAAARRRVSGGGDENQVSVQQELQADCFAGVWAHETNRRNILEGGDVEEGLRAAAAIGDDTLQRRSGGRVSPESFT
ncbi:MAG TPA: neutral zinc metallopeptidase, partial [Polyangiaceae bacterium]|nr:neutral zinc metallopeptidase [Polyangiaceae bacterium]